MPPPTNTPTPQPQSPPQAPQTPSPESQPSSDPWAEAFKTAIEKGDIPPDSKPPPTPEILSDQQPEPPEEPPQEPEGTEPEGEPSSTEPAKPVGRDLSAFEEADKPFLKQMSKGAFDHFSKRLQQTSQTITDLNTRLQEANKQLEVSAGKRLPDNWYAHEGAFKASPQYQEAEKQFFTAQQATHFWTDQLQAFKSGQDYYAPGDDGKPVLVKADESEPTDEVSISDARTMLYREQEKWANEANNIQKNFNSVYSSGEHAIKEWLAKELPWTQKQDAPEQNVKKQILAKIQEMTQVFHTHPCSELSACLGVQILKERAIHAEEIKQLKAKLGVRDDQRHAGPVPGRSARANAQDSKDRKLTLADFE